MRILALAIAAGLAFAPTSATFAESPAPEAVKKKRKKRPATGILWKVIPSHVVVYLDGKKLGEAGALEFTKTRAGKHTIRLVKGEDETEMDLSIKKGQRLTFVFDFTDS